MENVQGITNEVQRGEHKLISLEENVLKRGRSWSEKCREQCRGLSSTVCISRDGHGKDLNAHYYTCQKLMAGEVIGSKRVPAGAVKLAQ